VTKLLRSEGSGFATALTWVPSPALRSLTWGSGVENEPEALQAVAASLGIDLAFVAADVPWATEALERLAEIDVARGWIVAGVLGRVADDLGWSAVIRDSAARPGELAYALDEALHDALVEVRAGVSAGAEVLMIADDLAGVSGWLVAPDFALEALLPCYHRLLGEWAPHGETSVFHSDGDVRALMGALRTLGFDGIHLASLVGDAFAQSVIAARGAGLCPLGGIAARRMARGIARRSGAEAAVFAVSHGLIVADDGGMSTGEEVAAFGVALDAARAAASVEGS
jgi:hypothetical protein